MGRDTDHGGLVSMAIAQLVVGLEEPTLALVGIGGILYLAPWWLVFHLVSFGELLPLTTGPTTGIIHLMHGSVRMAGWSDALTIMPRGPC